MADQPIKGSEIIQPDWAANATKSANDLDTALQHLIQHTGILASNSKKVFPSADPKTIADLNAQNQAIEKSVELQKQDIQAKTIAAEVNKKVRDEIKASLSDYSRLSLEYRKAAQNAKDLAAADTLRGKAFSAATKEAIFKANGLNEQLKKVDFALGNYGRNVGNYASGFNALGNSINQLTREAPAFAVSLNTGFLALSNNIPILFDAISKTKNEIKALRAEGQQVPGLFARLTSSIFSWGTALSLGVTLLTLFGGKIADFITGTDKSTEALDKENDELERQKKLKQDLLDLGRASLTTEQVLLNIKSGADKSTISITELKDALADLEKQSTLFNTAQKQFDIDAQKVGLIGVDPEVYKKNKLQEQALRQADIDLLKKQITLIEGNTKVTKENNKAKKDEFDLLGQLINENEIRLNQQQKLNDFIIEYHQLLKEEGKFARAHIDDLKKEDDELERRNKNLAGQAGESSVSGKALTKKEIDAQNKANLQKLDNAKRLNDAIFKLSEDRIKAEQNLNKQQLSQIDTQLQQQFELLKNGQKNTYDFMLKQKAAALEEQAKLDKKARKEKEAEQLVNIFLEFLKADIAAGGGKNGFGAAAKALAQTALAKGLAEGLSGFYEGTEDTGSGGGLDSKGGMLAVLHPHERVLTAKQNAMIGSLSNDELVNSAFKYHIAEKAIKENETSNVIEEKLDEVVKAIKNIPKSNVEWKSLWIATQTATENGITTETTFINPPIIKRQQPFKN